MREAVIVEALRTPIARGKPIRGGLSAFHPATLLGKIQDAVVQRAGIEPALVEQIDLPVTMIDIAGAPPLHDSLGQS